MELGTGKGKSLAVHSEDLSNRWEKIAQDVPGKTIDRIKRYYQLLLEDLNDVESRQVPLPPYAEEGGASPQPIPTLILAIGGKGSDQERRKGIAWTEDEHRLSLLGPDKYGKGDWRSISRNFVISRTLTQVARHAQKYFIWLNSMNKDRRRASIHDITNVGNNGDISAPHGPITGQANEPMTVAGGKPSLQFLPGTPGIGAFGTTIGQPVGPLVSAIGTQFSIPVTPGQHMAFGVRAPVVGTWYRSSWCPDSLSLR